MSANDSISDTIARIKNAQTLGRASIKMPYSKFVCAFLKILEGEGYIEGFTEIKPTSEQKFSLIEIRLKYFNDRPVINEMKRVSKPGRRVYVAERNLPRVRNGLGIAIVSTSKGMMTDYNARQNNVGGELLCTVF